MIKTNHAYEADLVITSELGRTGFRLYGHANGRQLEEHYSIARFVRDRISALERFAPNSLVVCDLSELVLK